MKKKRKISDVEFLKILKENAGLYSQTANAIKTKFGIEYSRQAVRERAQRFLDELDEIIEESLDTAEGSLHNLMKNAQERVRLNAIIFYLKTKGRKRGYGMTEIPEPKLSEYEKKIKRMTMEELDAEIAYHEAELEKIEKGDN